MRHLVLVLTVLGCGSVNNATPDAVSNRATLTVTRSGAGMGSVTSSDSTIFCGTQCSVSVPLNTVVTLSATGDGGSTFTGWTGGGCSTGSTCAVTVTADTSVDAAFALGGLTVATIGGTSGKVVSSPAGIDCGTDCTEAFPADTMVTLTAMAGTDGTFTGWGGACSGTGTCMITASGTQSVTATFHCGGTQVFAYTGAIQTFGIPACSTSLVIDASGAQGGKGTTGTAAIGGMGAHIVGTFPKTSIAATALNVIVGGMGGAASYNGSGGGGSFVYVAPTDATPLIVAGGGGGTSTSPISTCTAGAGSSTQSPLACTGGAGCSAGGANGNGGLGGATSMGGNPGTGGGGAGWLTDGGNGAVATVGNGGKAARNGAAGGASAGTSGSIAGGFGGGGASAGLDGAPGGGGGFNGGGGANGYNNTSWGCAGGGGSYNGGSAQTNQAGVRAGNGTVTISWQ